MWLSNSSILAWRARRMSAETLLGRRGESENIGRDGGRHHAGRGRAQWFAVGPALLGREELRPAFFQLCTHCRSAWKPFYY